MHHGLSSIQSAGIRKFFHIAVNTAGSALSVGSESFSAGTRLFDFFGSITPRESAYVVLTGIGDSQLPTVSFEANSTSIGIGESTTINWSSSNTTSCRASGGWSGAKAISGSLTISPSATTVYSISCTGNSGTKNASLNVNVGIAPAPTISIATNSPSIAAGQSTVLSWVASGVTTCAASGGWSGSRAAKDSITVSPTKTTTYTLSCSGPGGPISGNTTVTVSANASTSLTVNGFAASYIGSTSPTTINLTGTGFNAVTQIAWSCTTPSGSACSAIAAWTSSTWANKFVHSVDTAATVLPTFLGSNDPPGTYNWTVVFSAGTQTVTKSFTVRKP